MSRNKVKYSSKRKTNTNHYQYTNETQSGQKLQLIAESNSKRAKVNVSKVYDSIPSQYQNIISALLKKKLVLIVSLIDN